MPYVSRPHQSCRCPVRMLAIGAKIACVAVIVGPRLHADPAPVEKSQQTQQQTQKPALVLPVDSVELDATSKRLPQGFHIVQSDRFVLISDADDALVAEHARWVERAFAEFERFADDCHMQPQPLRHKLMCVLFDHRNQYETFARTQDGMANPSFTGYYSPRNDRVVFTLEPEGQTMPGRPAVRTAMRSDAQAKPVLGFEAHQPALDASVDTEQTRASDPGRKPVLIDDTAAKCVHETIHQLMFHTGLMSPDVQYPLWICEGLSTAFETDSPEEAFGPDHNYAPRRAVFQSLLDHDELIPLRDMITITPVSRTDDRTIRAVYHQSYALVRWMCQERKAELRTYLTLMCDEPAGRLSAARHRELFASAFGNIETLESDWLKFEGQQQQQR